MFKKIYVFVAVLIAASSIHSSLAQDDYQKQLAGMSGVRLLGEFGVQLENTCTGSTPEAHLKCAQKHTQLMAVEAELGKRKPNVSLPNFWHSTDAVKPEERCVGLNESGDCVNSAGAVVIYAVPGAAL
jgi:hypothetical protein